MDSNLNKRILVPTDFSEICNNAIIHGAELAKFLSYDLMLVHIINSDTKSWMHKEGLSINDVEEKLSAKAEELSSEMDIEVSYLIKEGSIFSSITEVTKESGARLVVLGTHGKQGFQKLIGSFALRIILKSPVPVIVVQKRGFGKGYQKIVYPISDFTEDRQKVQWATHMSKVFHSLIQLYQIHENDAVMLDKMHIITDQIKEFFEENEVEYTIDMAQKRANFADQVIKFSTENDSDMIMIMTEPDVHTPDFKLSAWAEKLIFNTSQIPVMCLNPLALSKLYPEYISID